VFIYSGLRSVVPEKRSSGEPEAGVPECHRGTPPETTEIRGAGDPENRALALALRAARAKEG